MKFSGPTVYDLSGTWQVVHNNHLWNCTYVSKNEFNCGGSKITIKGHTITWKNKGCKGRIVRSGSSKNYDTIKWRDGSPDWKKQGK